MERPTGQMILDLARTKIGCQYVYGALADKTDPDEEVFDCAEFASWLVYQVAGILYGVRDKSGDPKKADAYTGYWARDCRLRGVGVTIREGMEIPGAFLLRSPGERRGHIAVSDGLGGTVEAHSTKLGVVASTAQGRVWTCGVLVPGIDYDLPKGLRNE